MKTVLLTMYYRDDLPARQFEIDACLNHNLQNRLIDQVIVFTEEFFSNIMHSKLSQQVIKERLTYQCAFEFANKNLVGDICMLSNSDIFFDDTLISLQRADMTDKLYAITRHNVQPDGSLLFTDAGTCQDVWIFKSPIKTFTSNFGMGRPGCDNRVAWEARNAGLKVLNPCKVITCRHLHLTNKRNYMQNQPQIPGPYDWVDFGNQL